MKECCRLSKIFVIRLQRFSRFESEPTTVILDGRICFRPHLLFSVPSTWEFEMRNKINSSIANVIRCNAIAVDMLRGFNAPASYQWHTQHCASVCLPTGGSSKSYLGRLLTGVEPLVRGIFKSLTRTFVELLTETTGRELQPCLANAGSSVSPRVS